MYSLLLACYNQFIIIICNYIERSLKMETQVHPMAEAFIKKTRRTYLCMLILVPIGILLTASLMLYNTGSLEDTFLFVGIFVGITAFIELEIFIISRIMLKKIKENTLTIGTDFLQRAGKKSEHPIEFKHIQKLYIKKEKNKEIAYIEIQTSTQKIRLCGFENLTAIADLLMTQATQAELKEKNYKFDYNHPVILLLTFFGTLFICYFSLTKFSLALSDVISVVIGIWLLFFKPISKAQGARFAKLELILGILILICFGLKHLIPFFC